LELVVLHQGWFRASASIIAPGGTSGEVRFKQFVNDGIDVTYTDGDQETTGTNGELWLDREDSLCSEEISVWIWGGPVPVITFYDCPSWPLLSPTGQKKVHRQSSFIFTGQEAGLYLPLAGVTI
jgi:hypothetical protein